MPSDLHCPRCGRKLFQSQHGANITFECPKRHGLCMTLAGVRQVCGSQVFVNALWQNAYFRAPFGDLSCPVCRRVMKRVVIPVNGGDLELDICCRCQEIWFDPGELQALPRERPPEPPELPPAAREALALHAVARMEQEASGWDPGDAMPDDFWNCLAALLGFPVKNESVIGRPYITWGLVLLCAAVFLLTCGQLESIINDWGFIPAQPWRHVGLTPLTSMVLHAGWIHLGVNMYFLFAFGSDTENTIGPWEYLGLILLSGLGATLLHGFFFSWSSIPCVGASGFISGILAAFAVLYPCRRLTFMLTAWFHFCWIPVPAWMAFLLWVGYQLLAMVTTVSDADKGGVAYTAHLGGAIAGAIFGAVMRYRQQKAAEDFERRPYDG